MAITLYDTSVTLFIQTIGALDGVLAKGLAHCKEAGIDPAEIVETRIYQDMLPFRYQVLAATQHSIGAIEGVKAGLFTPGRDATPYDYAALQAKVSETLAALKALSADEINALEGRDVVFKLGERSMPFTAQGFLHSFSLPDLHFHATTAYDILRSKGVALGKGMYLGRLQLKG